MTVSTDAVTVLFVAEIQGVGGQAKGSFDVWLPRVLGGLAAAPVVLGVIKTLGQASSGEGFNLTDAAYFVGCISFGALVGIFFGILLAGLAAFVSNEVLKLSSDEWVLYPFGAVAIIGLIMGFALAGEPDTAGGFFQSIGLISVVGSGIGYAKWKEQHKSSN